MHERLTYLLLDDSGRMELASVQRVVRFEFITKVAFHLTNMSHTMSSMVPLTWSRIHHRSMYMYMYMCLAGFMS
jgi:hypothetical protein